MDFAPLPPGVSEFVWEMEVEEPGDFAVELHLFVEDPSTREIRITVRGTAR
jgi:hypothetical protein